MKRIPLLTLLAFGAIGTGAYAQSLSLGVRAGVDRASATTGMEGTVSPHSTAIYGGMIEVEILPPFAFQAGVQVAERRTTITRSTPGLPNPAPTTYSFNYFEIPVSLKLAFGKPAFQIYGLAGANLGTVMKAVGETPGGGSEDIKANLDKTSVALELGGGIGIQFASHTSLVLDGRYNMGLKDINTSGQAMLDAGAWKPRDLRVTAGLVFRIGR